jgi:adenylate cyclase
VADGTADSNPARALTGEIVASEQLRVRVLVGVLAVTTIIQVVVLTFWGDQIAALSLRPVPWWIPLAVVGPYLVYESGVMGLLAYFARRGRGMPTAGRFGNAFVMTTLPTVAILVVNHYAGLELAFGGWPPILYVIFILAATLRLDFALPFFTGLSAAAQFMWAASRLAPLELNTSNLFSSPIFYGSKAVLMIVAGAVAGLVALRLRAKLERVIEEAAARERVTSLFGQHVSPEVVNNLLHRPTDARGETRQVCAMFLDIRNFTAQARARRPDEVVDFLNGHFAFMIEAVDRNRGIVTNSSATGSSRCSGYRSTTRRRRAMP